MIENFSPVMGKNVLETLTTGMYDDARFIYREYIQNAADQIDIAVEERILEAKNKGEINIEINAFGKTIVIEDNATGIESSKVLQFLGDVANSKKDRSERKGFRGIGRLGGLGYCDKLIFETSYKGESIKNRLILDAKELQKIILDIKDTSDASTVISVITKIEKSEDSNESHYLRVIMENVNEKLLDEASIVQYLSMVAPLPFNSQFSFTNEIKEYFENNNVFFDEYNVKLNGNYLFKAYKDHFYAEDNTESKLLGVDFIEIRNDEQELLALCWYGYRDQSNIVLPEINYERGIRIRTKNITIGDESTCQRFFDSARTNLRFIGEIHTVSDSFIPNARRDYFTENVTCVLFEERAKLIFKSENLENRLAQTASKLYNRLREIETYRKTHNEFETLKGSFDSLAAEKHYLDKLRVSQERAFKASKDIQKVKSKTDSDPNISKLYDHIIGNTDVNILVDSLDNFQVSQYDPPTFTKLSPNEAKVVNEVFDIIEDTLSFKESEFLKKRIIEKFN